MKQSRQLYDRFNADIEDESGQALLSSTVRLAAARMEDLADIINVAIELWLAKIESGLNLCGISSDTTRVCSGC